MEADHMDTMIIYKEATMKDANPSSRRIKKKEGKERGQTNRETGGKTACDSWDPAHPARDPKVETRADGADYAGCGTGRLFFLSGRKRKKIT